MPSATYRRDEVGGRVLHRGQCKHHSGLQGRRRGLCTTTLHRQHIRQQQYSKSALLKVPVFLMESCRLWKFSFVLRPTGSDMAGHGREARHSCHLTSPLMTSGRHLSIVDSQTELFSPAAPQMQMNVPLLTSGSRGQSAVFVIGHACMEMPKRSVLAHCHAYVAAIRFL